MTTTATTVTSSTKHGHLHTAKKTKNDEFYTQFRDIETELNKYVDYNADAFRGKTILLPCDDPEWSNFTKLLALKFDDFGIKKIISTSYNPGGRGKVFTLDGDANGDGHINLDDLRWEYLDGDGDFRSDEVKTLRDQADIVITNPPFSLFREFLAWIVDADKQFLIIGNKNAITYKEVFPLIKANKMWTGVTGFNKDMLFTTPEPVNTTTLPESAYRIVGGITYRRAAAIWFTNIDHGRRHEPLSFMTAADCLRYAPKVKGKTAYDRYDNYDAIEVPHYKAIPSDHEGVMGVPISFLDKYCPEQFEIVRFRHGNDGKDLTITHGGTTTTPYFRILIKHRTKVNK